MAEMYSDTTAWKALKNIIDDEKRRAETEVHLLERDLTTIDWRRFTVVGAIKVMDKVTGKKYSIFVQAK